MARHYRNYSPDQMYLMAPDPRDWLSSDHLAYQVRDVVALFDLTLVHSAYSSDGRGAPAFAPQMMLCVLLYAQYKGVFSSRAMARLCMEDVGARYLAAGTPPDHRSIGLFRIRHKEVIRELFKQSVLLCRAAGMVTLKHVAIDGSKVAGAGSKEQSRTYSYLLNEKARAMQGELRLIEEELRIKEEDERLNAAMESLVQMGLDMDAAEDAELGEENDGYSLPDHLKSSQDRVAALEKAKTELAKSKIELAKARAELSSKQEKLDAGKEALEARAKEREARLKEEWDNTAPAERPHRKKPNPVTTVAEATDKYNFTDPESRLMKARGGYIQGYNAQAAVDSDHQIIVGCAVTEDCTDYRQLLPMAEQIVSNTGETPNQILADGGYFSEREFSRAEAASFNVLIPPGKRWQQKLLPPIDCAHGVPQPIDCAHGVPQPIDCAHGVPQPIDSGQEGSKASGEETTASQEQDTCVRAKERMHNLLATVKGKADYAHRAKTVEPVFAQIKGSPGNPRFTRFLRRTRARADQDWCLVCLGHNLRKLLRFQANDKDNAGTTTEQEPVAKAVRQRKQRPQFANMILQGI